MEFRNESPLKSHFYNNNEGEIQMSKKDASRELDEYPAEGEVNENKTCNRIDIAGAGRSGCPAKCRDRDCKVFALAVFTTAGTHEPYVHGGRGCSRVTFRNHFSRKIEEHQVII
jgi:hypothetical protein